MNQTPTAAIALALLVALAACGDDNTTGVTGDALTDAETGALAEVVAGGLFSTFEQSQGPLMAPSPVSGTLSVNVDVPCEFGGKVAVDGNLAFDFDDQTGYGTATYTVTEDHQGCVAESEDGIRFTLNGEPNVTANFTVTTQENDLSFTGDFGGGVAWVTGEKSGTCPLDVEFSLTGNLATESGTASLSGTVCGVTFSHELSISA